MNKPAMKRRWLSIVISAVIGIVCLLLAHGRAYHSALSWFGNMSLVSAFLQLLLAALALVREKINKSVRRGMVETRYDPATGRAYTVPVVDPATGQAYDASQAAPAIGQPYGTPPPGAALGQANNAIQYDPATGQAYSAPQAVPQPQFLSDEEIAGQLMAIEQAEREQFSLKMKAFGRGVALYFGVWVVLLFLRGLIPTVFVASAFVAVSMVMRIVGFAILIWFFRIMTSKNNDKAYSLQYKHTMVRKELQKVFTDVYLDPLQGLPSERVKMAGLVPMGNRYKSEDYLRGSYKGVPFEQADVVIEYESTDSEGHTTTTTYFAGQFIYFQLPKSIQYPFMVWDKQIGHTEKRRAKKAGLQQVQLEDVNFNNRYEIWAQNPADVFYILTPILIENLNRISTEGNTLRKVALQCYGNQMLVAVNNGRNAFEAKSVRDGDPNTLNEIRAAIHSDIAVLTGTIEAIIRMH